MAMSGGVDSSVSALLLRDAGYTVCGCTMKLFDNDAGQAGGAIIGESSCCSQRDVEDARQVALDLGIEHFTFNYTGTFGRDVIDRFCSAYVQGRTPNPCIDCNRYLKFQALQQRRAQLGYDYVATGHYARSIYNAQTGRYELHRGLDASKDQSYVLFHLTQDTLAHMLFPLGELTKQQVRALAAQHHFGNAEKPESQDICFVPNGDYAGFIARYCGLCWEGEATEGDAAQNASAATLGTAPGVALAVPAATLGTAPAAAPAEVPEAAPVTPAAALDAASVATPGAVPAAPEAVPAATFGNQEPQAAEQQLTQAFTSGAIVDTAGKKLGQHRGLIHYTIGQRKGIGVAAAEPLYVIAKDVVANTLVVGSRAELGVTEVRADDVNFIGVSTFNTPTRVQAKTHYRQKAQAGTAFMEGDTLCVRFDQPVVRPAVGQALVVYDGETGDSVLAGGTITTRV